MSMTDVQEEKTRPFFSIVMPMYNAESFVARAIESVICQTFSEWELVIVDDCSQDFSPSIVSRYAVLDPRIHVLRNDVNSKITQSRNRGVEAAVGKWIVVLDADDFFEPEYLEILRASITDRDKTSRYFFSSWVNIVDEFGEKIIGVKLPDADTIRRMMRMENFLYHSGTSYPRELWREVGGYPQPRRMIGEDAGIWMRFFQSGAALYMIERPLVSYRIHYSNITAVCDGKLTAEAAMRGIKAKIQNKEWRISLYLKQRMLKAARQEIILLFQTQRRFSLKTLHYFFLTYMPANLVYFFMWEFRPYLRSLVRVVKSRASH